MKKQRVLVLMHRDLVPPEDALPEVAEKSEWRTEFDVVATLKWLGHEVYPLGVLSDLGKIREAITEFKPHVAFNLLEEFDGEAVYDQNVVGYLQLLKVPFTGCNPQGLMLSRDKALSKKILHYHRIPVPKFQSFPLGKRVSRRKDFEFPMIVKSQIEESSLGISQASVVRDDEKLSERVAFIHEKVGTDAIAESYIDGRELYVGAIGNKRISTFPVWEMEFDNLAPGSPAIATSEVKHNPKYRKKRGIESGPADLDPKIEADIIKYCRRVYRRLNLSGYARMDFRLSTSGKLYCIEANPNPDIAETEDFAQSALKAGMDYPTLINRILSTALSGAKA